MGYCGSSDKRTASSCRDGVLVTNVSSTKELRKKCKEEGIYLTHSATFPLGIPTICGLLTTEKGDTVLDCFAGTATTGEFALSFKRRFIGYELNPEFIRASQIRLQMSQRIFPEIKPIKTSNFLSPRLKNYIQFEPPFEFSISPESSFNKIEPVTPELKKSFTNFTKVYNDCFRVVQEMI